MFKNITKILLLSLFTLGSQLLLSGCADAGKNQKANLGDTVNLDGSASEGRYGFTILGYKWKQIKGEDVEIKDANESMTSFIAVDTAKKKRNKLVFELTTVEKAYWGQLIEFRDRVKITVEKSTYNDVTPPVITLNGDVNMELFVGDTYIEESATATDIVDGNVSVTIEGTVDTSKEGTYTVTYNATDSAGNTASIKRTVTVQAPTLTNLTLESNTSTLNTGEQVSFEVTGTYSDGNSKKVDANITWIINPTDSLEVNGIGFIAKKDGNITIKAKINDVVSNTLSLKIVWIINGYKLPPEPDPTVNNATLLGIDSNANGVRDDVERKIIIKYQKPIEIELMMSNSKVTQEILASPLSEAQGLQKEFSRVGDCEMYLLDFGIDIKRSVKYSEDFTYNTRNRAKKYIEYNKALSGGVYGGSPADETAEACDFDVEQMLKDRK